MAYIKHDDLCGSFKGMFQNYLFSFSFLSHALTLITTHVSLCRRHTSSDSCSHRHTTRGAHTRSCKYGVLSVSCPLLLSRVTDPVSVSRSPMGRGNTRSVSRVHLVLSRFCWSIRTRPVPLLLFCPSLLQMTSFRTSQHLPPSRPLLPPRSTRMLPVSHPVY